jgi:hypothetical protein
MVTESFRCNPVTRQIGIPIQSDVCLMAMGSRVGNSALGWKRSVAIVRLLEVRRVVSRVTLVSIAFAAVAVFELPIAADFKMRGAGCRTASVNTANLDIAS